MSVPRWCIEEQSQGGLQEKHLPEDGQGELTRSQELLRDDLSFEGLSQVAQLREVLLLAMELIEDLSESEQLEQDSASEGKSDSEAEDLQKLK